MTGRIGVLGAGGVGSAYAGFLARAGHDVVLVGRGSPHVRAVAASGLVVRPPDGEPWGVEVDTRLFARDLPAASIDLLLVLTKAFDTVTACTAAAHALSAGGVAFSPQNGLGCDESLAGVFGGSRSLVGVTTVGAALQEPGQISVSVSTAAGRSLTHVGTTASATGGHRAQDLVDVLSSALLPAVSSPDVAVHIWEKLALAAMSPVCAVLQRTVGHIWSSREGQDLVHSLFDEVVAVAATQGVRLDGDTAWQYASAVFEGTGEHFTSMATDVMNGRRTELSSMAGAVQRFGIEHHVPVPVHTTVLGLLGVLGVH